MPETKITRLPKSEVKIEFTVSVEEAKPYLDETVKDLSTAKPLPGFRPGMATYADAKRAFGEMAIWERALERLVRAFYVRTILAEGLDTVGSPSVAVDQLTPGAPIRFSTITPVEPTVTAFPDLEKCRVTKKTIAVTDEQATEAVDHMRKMQRSEALVDRAATMDDLVVIDLEMKKDHVTLEGGSGRDYRVFLSEPHYIPGFTKELEGIKTGEERTFSLSFPSVHFQKYLAGQPVEFTAKAKGVFALQMPPADDAFAKTVGLESLQALRDKLKENIGLEQDARASEAAEIEMLEKLVDDAAFSDIPDLLVNEEVKRMLHELEHGAEDQGMRWQDYLASIRKTTDQLKLDFAPQAMRRIKTAVLIKQLAKKEGVSVSDEELDKEIDRILSGLRESGKETRERVSSPDYRDYIAVQMRNRKMLERLKEQCIGK